jgi:thioredoxin 1
MASDKVKILTDGNFDEQIKQGVTLVDFWAPWCGPCRLIAPSVDALASEFEGRATVAKMNVDENPNVPARFRVLGIPTLLLFKDGELAETIVGLRPKDELAGLLNRHVPVAVADAKPA